VSTPPDPKSDLRAIAKALAGDRRAGSQHEARRPPSSARRRSPWIIYLTVAAVAAALTHTIRTLAICGFGVCPEDPRVAELPVATDDETTAVEAAFPEAVATVGVATDRNDRLASTDVKTLLAVERNEVPVATPLPRLVVIPPERAPLRGADRRPEPRATEHAVRRSDPPPPATKKQSAEPAAAVVARRAQPTAAPQQPVEAPAAPEAADTASDDGPSSATADDVDEESTPNLAGRWMVTNAIQRTSYPAFRGLRVRFRVELEQHGNRITGRGRKFTIDDKPIPPDQRNPIVLEGTVRGRDVFVRFVEHGTRRDSNGGFRWRLSPDGQRLEGTFDSTAADTAGRSHANREG
jgi:hypothetical protein